jgi:GNAT superfamily N-acetyltransferase
MGITFIDLEPDDPRLLGDLLPVLVQLRTELTADALVAIYREGHPQGLRFTAGYDEHGSSVVAAGWRVIATTIATRKLYVDDLVTDAAYRGRGAGSEMLAELARRATGAGCTVIDLDSGLHRADAHRFYIRERMPITSFHFARILR